MRIKFGDIIVPKSFVATTPREEKLEECRFWFKNYGRIDREIVVNSNNEIIDGYIAYLVMKENDFAGNDIINVKQSNRRKKRWYRKNTENWTINEYYKRISTVYIFGKHHEDGKEFCWRLADTKRDSANEIIPGNKIVVNTRFGNKVVVVTRVEELNECPVDGRVRKVIRW